MCKLIAIVYFLLFVAKFVECVYIPEDDDKNTEINEKSEDTAKNQETHNSNATSETTINNDDKLSDEPEQYDRSGRVKETDEDSATEETNRRFADSKESTVFVGSLAKTLHDALSGENVSEDVTVGRTAADSHQEESTETTDPGEIFVYTPQQSQDPVLDLKARTGRVDEDDKEERDDGTYHDEARIGHLPRDNANNNRRSGYEAPGVDDNDDDWKLTNPQQRRIPTSGPSGQSFNYQHFNENRYPSTSWKSKMRAENNYHHSPRLSHIYEGGKSRELLYPSYNSRELMGQTNSYSGNLMKSYFGLQYPNRQLFTGRSREMCSSCNKDNFRPIERARSGDIYSSPDDHGYRRSIHFQNDAQPLDKANSRSVDHDPSAANDYPLQLDHDENTDGNRAHSSWSHEAMDPGKNGRLYSKDVDGSFSPKIGRLTKMLMNLPSYNLPRNSQMARMGLARASRSIL